MNNLLLIGNLGTGEILIIALIVLLLFGGKKIPELARALGKAKGEFSEGLKEGEKEDELPSKEEPKQVEA